MAQGVLGDQYEAERSDQVVDAVVDLRVDVIGAAAHHDDVQAVLPGVIDILLARGPHIPDVGLILLVSIADSGGGFLLGNVELVLQNLFNALSKVLPPPQTHVGVEEAGGLEAGHIGGQQLGVVGHHRAVIVVVTDALVVVVGHTGIPNGVYSSLHQCLNMAVEQLGGVAHRVRRNSTLALDVQFPGGLGGEHHLEVQRGEQPEPEGEVFVHIQPEGNADPPAGAVALTLPGIGMPQGVIFIAHQIGQLCFFLAQRPGAAVAGDESPPAVKGVDGQRAVIGAKVAGDGFGSMRKRL